MDPDNRAIAGHRGFTGSGTLGQGSWDPIPFTITDPPGPAGDGLTEFVTLEFEPPAGPTMFFRVGVEP